MRWWDTALDQVGGVSLTPPEGLEDGKFAVVDDTWHANEEPFVNQKLINERFPIYQDKHYR